MQSDIDYNSVKFRHYSYLGYKNRILTVCSHLVYPGINTHNQYCISTQWCIYHYDRTTPYIKKTGNLLSFQKLLKEPLTKYFVLTGSMPRSYATFSWVCLHLVRSDILKSKEYSNKLRYLILADIDSYINKEYEMMQKIINDKFYIDTHRLYHDQLKGYSSGALSYD